MHRSYTNETILTSVPIKKDLKRFLLNWYDRMVTCNGRAFADEKLKELRVIALQYRADPRRHDNVSSYLRAIPIRRKGWLKLLLHYLDCQPRYILNFLKFNIGMSDPEMTVSESAVEQVEYLDETETRVDTRVPRVIQDWIKLVLGPSLSLLERFVTTVYEPDTPFSRMLKALDSSESFSYEGYRRKWRRYLLRFHRLSEQECRTLIESRIPTPEVYKDYKEVEYQTSGTSDTLDNDYWGICHIVQQRYDLIQPGLSEDSLGYIRGYLNQSPNSFNLWEDGSGPWYPDNPRDLSIGTVGQVHHIPKKGTTVRRPIAVPNRFIQAGLAPAQQQLYAMLRNLPCDCTFDQNLFDRKIQNRVNNSALYVASVDLSKATDNLP